MIAIRCGSSGGSEVLRFRSSGAAGVLVHDGAGVTPHRWLKVAFSPSHLVKATFSHYRTASEATTVTPTTSAPPEPRSAPPEEPHPLAIMVLSDRVGRPWPPSRGREGLPAGPGRWGSCGREPGRGCAPVRRTPHLDWTGCSCASVWCSCRVLHFLGNLRDEPTGSSTPVSRSS